MSRLDLTTEERRLAEDMARDRSSVGSRLGFYASVLVPIILFGGYGVLRFDAVALGVAFLGLLIFVGWRISREFRYLPTYKSLFRKIAEHERQS